MQLHFFHPIAPQTQCHQTRLFQQARKSRPEQLHLLPSPATPDTTAGLHPQKSGPYSLAWRKPNQTGQPGLVSTRSLQAFIFTVTKFGSQTQTISLGIPDEFQQALAVFIGFCRDGRYYFPSDKFKLKVIIYHYRKFRKHRGKSPIIPLSQHSPHGDFCFLPVGHANTSLVWGVLFVHLLACLLVFTSTRSECMCSFIS